METDKVLALAREAANAVKDFHMEVSEFHFTTDSIQDFAALIPQQMIEDGWRQCAEGQGTTQFCPMAEQALRAAEDLRIELSERL